MAEISPKTTTATVLKLVKSDDFWQRVSNCIKLIEYPTLIIGGYLESLHLLKIIRLFFRKASDSDLGSVYSDLGSLFRFVLKPLWRWKSSNASISCPQIHLALRIYWHQSLLLMDFILTSTVLIICDTLSRSLRPWESCASKSSNFVAKMSSTIGHQKDLHQ